MENKKRMDFLARLRMLLESSRLSQNEKENVWKDYVEWGEYFDKRYFNSAQVVVQYLTGRIMLDQELKELVSPIIAEMALALEDFAQRIINLSVLLLETRQCSLGDLESLTSGLQKVTGELMKEALKNKSA